MDVTESYESWFGEVQSCFLTMWRYLRLERRISELGLGDNSFLQLDTHFLLQLLSPEDLSLVILGSITR